MPWLMQLIEGASSSTVDLNDGTTYQVNVNGFHAPPPSRRLSMSGGNFYRHGSDMIARVYDNRTITINFSIIGSNATALGTAVRDIWTMLRKAEEFQRSGLGTLVQLKYQWAGAPSPVFFNVIEGVLDLGQDAHSSYLLQGTRIQRARLELLCEPFAQGTAETVENWLNDPSFEVAGSALADWVTFPGTGSVTRITTNSKFGTAAAQILKTTAIAQSNGFQQNLTTAVWTAGGSMLGYYWHQSPSLPGAGITLTVNFRNTTGTQIGSIIATSTVTGSTFVQLVASGTAPGTGTGTIEFLVWYNGGTGTGTSIIDNCYLGTNTSLPNAWVSGRALSNHFDDNGQAHINYVDLYGVPGDMPAALQILLSGSSQANEVWVGARHAGRLRDANIFLEAENFTLSTGSGTFLRDSGGTYSNGSVTVLGSVSNNFAAPLVCTLNIPTPPLGLYRVLAQAKFNGTDHYLGVGYTYGSVVFTPTATSDYVRGTVAGGTMQIYDLGALTIPPIDTPGSSTIGTFTLRIAVVGLNPALTTGVIWDYIHLMPVDMGMVYASATALTNTANLLIDSTSRPRGAYILSTANVVQAFPANQVGSAPEAHPQGSRFYILHTRGGGGGTPTGSATVKITYTPKFLHV